MLLAACRTSRGPSEPPTPTLGEAPAAISPVQGRAVESNTPTLVVLNARGFDAGQASYEFVVLDAAGTVVEDLPGVTAGATRTEVTIPRPLPRGFVYRWKAIARAGERQAESQAAAFEVAVPCTPGDPYAKAVLDLQLSDCTRRTNRRALLDGRSVLGPPDARGMTEETYTGFLSLGEDGLVTVDMGVCMSEGEGPELRVFQYIQDEPVGVEVSGDPNGPWIDLGVKRCGEGGTGDRANHCDFDLAGTGIKTARYVRVSDAESFPCERAGTRTEGADIDAIQVLR